MKQKTVKVLALLMAALICLTACATNALENDRNPDAEQVVRDFFACLAKRDFEGAYAFLSVDSQQRLSASTFAERFSGYLKLLEIDAIDVSISRCTNDSLHSICTTSFVYRSQLGDDISNFQQLELVKQEREWRLTWTPTIIHPDMAEGDRVRARTLYADRGEIFAQGTLVAANVPGITILLEPANLKDPESTIRALSPLINMEEADIWEEYEKSTLQAQVRVERLYLRDEPTTDARSEILLTLGMGELVQVLDEGQLYEPLPPVDDEINFIMATPSPSESPQGDEAGGVPMNGDSTAQGSAQSGTAQTEQEETLSQVREGFYRVRYEARVVKSEPATEAPEEAGQETLPTGTPVPPQVTATPTPPPVSHNYSLDSQQSPGEYAPPQQSMEPTEQPQLSAKPVTSEESLTEADSASLPTSPAPTASDAKKSEQPLPGETPSLQEETDANGNKTLSVEGYVYAPYVRLRHSQDLVLLKSFRSDELDAAILEAIKALPGVRVDTDNYAKYRSYPYGEAMFHLLGYVANINAEQLAEHRETCAAQGIEPVYSPVSQIGASGIEKQYEEQLRGRNGYEVYLADENGAVKTSLYQKPVEQGRDVHLTIDPGMQKWAYDLMRLYLTEDQSGSIVTTDPQTGAVLAMVSYPSIDPNRIFTMPSAEWEYINLHHPTSPLFNRATQSMFAPGSIFKPFTAVMGLENGKISTDTVFPYMNEVEENKWYPDPENWAWGNMPPITRIEKINGTPDFRTAMRDSDNIYFAWVAMLVGKDTFMSYCREKLGFEEAIPFDLPVARSGIFDPERDPEQPEFHIRFLAESGYGQGQMYMTPIHATATFGAFANGGDVMEPYVVESLRHSEGIEYVVDEAHEPVVWKKDVVTDDYVLNAVVSGLEETMSSGTGRSVTAPYALAGKTGTAQAYMQDGFRRELGWLVAFKNEGAKDFLAAVVIDCKEKEGSARYPIMSSLFDYQDNLSKRTGMNAESLPVQDIPNYQEPEENGSEGENSAENASPQENGSASGNTNGNASSNANGNGTSQSEGTLDQEQQDWSAPPAGMASEGENPEESYIPEGLEEETGEAVG